MTTKAEIERFIKELSKHPPKRSVVEISKTHHFDEPTDVINIEIKFFKTKKELELLQLEDYKKLDDDDPENWRAFESAPMSKKEAKT